MSHRWTPGLRRLLLWGLCALLLAAQHAAWRHALSHLEQHAHQETAPHPEAGAGCTLCLASAAAMQLASPSAGAAPALRQGALPAALRQAAPAATHMSGGTRNRGPPGRA